MALLSMGSSLSLATALGFEESYKSRITVGEFSKTRSPMMINSWGVFET